jgi:hypothetical protein
LGDDFVLSNQDRVTSVQAISGTGALRLAAEFIGKFMPGKPCYISNPSWGMYFYYSCFEVLPTKGAPFVELAHLFFPLLWPSSPHLECDSFCTKCAYLPF